ncbi:hypothetical protein EI555_001293, partial [Monodon monoceros]
MYTSAARGLPAGVPAQDPEPKEALGLGQLSSELLVMVLSHVPQHTLLGHCRQGCRHWHDLVDCQALWLRILARGHATLPCVLGRFCESTPIGRNLLPNPSGEAFLKWTVPTGGDAWGAEENWEVTPRACIQTSFLWCQKKQVSDLEEEGLWPELLDTGKPEIFVSASDWWTDQQYTDSLYGLTVQPLDANQAVLHHSFPWSSPIQQCRKSFSFEASHVFSNRKKVVRFVSFEHLVRDIDFWSEQYGVYLSHSSVINLIPVAEKIPAPNFLWFQDWDQDSELKAKLAQK